MATKTAMERYKRLLKNNSDNAYMIPFKTLNVDECLELVNISGNALEFIPSGKRTKKLCIAAVENMPEALEFVPNRFKTVEMCKNAYKKSIKAFPYLLPKMYTVERCIDCYNRIDEDSENVYWLERISTAIPYEFHKEIDVFEKERALEVRYIKLKKYYNGKFVVVESVMYEKEDVESVFSSFDEFYTFVQKDLKEADLLAFDFVNIDISKIDITGAYVNSEVLIKNNLYSDQYYKDNIWMDEGSTELVPVEPQPLVNEFVGFDDCMSDDVRKIFYISDLHLNHKLLKEFPQHATQSEVKYFIKKLVRMLVEPIKKISLKDVLLIAGDVSYNFEIAKMFYKELAKVWFPENIIVVLGNHELWNYGAYEKDQFVYETVVEKYRQLFKSLKIQFLQNDMLLIKSKGSYFEEMQIITEEELRQNDSKWIKEQCEKSRLTVLGGLGFSGENKEFNATQGVYRNTISTLEEDIKQTKKFKDIYDIVKSALDKKRIVVLTHTPIKDWNNEKGHSNWIYVNGHTHRNYYCIDDSGAIFADNQVGYHAKNMYLKHFELSLHYDIFSDYTDGIYDISKNQYIDFYRGLNVPMEFNSNGGQIKMIKRDGLYCFLYRADNNKLYFLKGGGKRKLQNQSLEYYFNTMAIYKLAMEHVFNDYHKALKQISGQIKSIGGDGRIHGSIVDINEKNHIYLDPMTGKLTFYYAEHMAYRYEYPSLETLLKDKMYDLYLNYKKEYLDHKNSLQIFFAVELDYALSAKELITDTSMYKPSNLFRSFQYMFDVNVIREWNEVLIERAIDKYLGDQGLLGIK